MRIPVKDNAPLAPDATATLTDDGIAVSYSFGSGAPVRISAFTKRGVRSRVTVVHVRE